MDGKYDYHEAYYRIIQAIQEPFDQTWADSLLEWWNMLFGDKAGIPVFDFASCEARLKSVSSDAQGSTLPSDPGSDTSVINMTSTPATTPPPIEEPAPVQQKPSPSHVLSYQLLSTVVTPNVDAELHLAPSLWHPSHRVQALAMHCLTPSLWLPSHLAQALAPEHLRSVAGLICPCPIDAPRRARARLPPPPPPPQQEETQGPE
ncbi:uncharacterized protein HD556DRAFT_1451965 [Suillus plorans]|uniref:Uncharacterized protein n=1 Tax=Suillus plorans TaxID=116603 RepID=A0A9P7A8K4_9AGAM|nr:uncharacterized protein HD556DRAFT_1451965 [Suillus plorans]KAG1784281.1 hypothetical protein HD556DRAFT_1451965 [Suillus plorans]